jgi:hypothetical protein
MPGEMLRSAPPKKPVMTRSPSTHEIRIEVDGHLVATAEVSPTEDPDVVHSAMHVESGHLPAGSRTRLVDAVLDDPQVAAVPHLAASVPMGDTELLDRMRERAGSVDVRAAGATVLVEMDKPRAQKDPDLMVKGTTDPSVPPPRAHDERRPDDRDAATRADLVRRYGFSPGLPPDETAE